MQILGDLLSVTISQILFNCSIDLNVKICTGMNIRTVFDQLSHQFYICVIYAFRVSEDFRYMDGYSNLKKNIKNIIIRIKLINW